MELQSLTLASDLHFALENLFDDDKRLLKKYSADAALLISAYVEAIEKGKENHGTLCLSLIELFGFRPEDSVTVDFQVYKDFNERVFRMLRGKENQILFGGEDGPNMIQLLEKFEGMFTTNSKFLSKNTKCLGKSFWASQEAIDKYSLPVQVFPDPIEVVQKVYITNLPAITNPLAIQTPLEYNTVFEKQFRVFNHLFYVLGYPGRRKIVPVIGMSQENYALKDPVRNHHFLNVFARRPRDTLPFIRSSRRYRPFHYPITVEGGYDVSGLVDLGRVTLLRLLRGPLKDCPREIRNVFGVSWEIFRLKDHRLFADSRNGEIRV